MQNPLLEISKILFRSSITQNVHLYAIFSSDTGNLLKTHICDLLQLLEPETVASELLTRLRRYQKAGPTTPPPLQRVVHHTAAQRIQTAPAQTRELSKRNKQIPNNASTNSGGTSIVLEAIHKSLTALRFTYVPLRSKGGLPAVFSSATARSATLTGNAPTGSLATGA